MKILSSILAIGIAILLVISAAMAGNVADIEQVAPGNTATSIQTGDLNHIESIQETGGTNFLDAEQVGNNHVLDLDQDSPTGSAGKNTATINQEVSGAAANADSARIKQTTKSTLSGITNSATVTQKGGGNKLRAALSSGNISAAVTSTAKQEATGAAATAINKLLVLQEGGNNDIGLFQKGSDLNDADIVQKSGSNDLGAYQLTTTGKNELEVDQLTGGNSAKLIQKTGGTGDNWAKIIQ